MKILFKLFLGLVCYLLLPSKELQGQSKTALAIEQKVYQLNNNYKYNESQQLLNSFINAKSSSFLL